MMTGPASQTASRETKGRVLEQAGSPAKMAAAGSFLLLVALIAFALNLRSPLTAIPPIVVELRAALGIEAATASLLTSIPVLCFGLLTPLASLLIGRVGIERSVFIALAAVALGTLVRAGGTLGLALSGTVIIGAALTIGNIVSLLVIARDFPRARPMVTGIYTSALNVGTMLTSAATAPLATHFGWRMALSAWTGLALLAGLFWGLALWRRRRSLSAPQPEAEARPTASAAPPREVWRRPLSWLLAIAFACHIFVYYGLTAWLPAFLMQINQMTLSGAGYAASLFQILALTGSFGIPALASAARIGRANLLVAIGLCWVATPVGFLLAPQLWLLWALTGGIASGGGFTVIFMLIMERSADLAENRKTSALVQGVGYTVAAGGPFVVGALRQATGGWAAGFLVLAAIAAVMAVTGVLAGRR